EPVHFLQIWIQPTARNIEPGYEQKTFPATDKQGRLRVVASPDGRDGSVTIHADAIVHAGVFGAGEQAELSLATDRHAWVHVARGSVRVNGELVTDGDGVALTGEPAVRVEGIDGDPGEVLVFDLG
nr:pirin family protein [Deltaproteobacteria bacterium]